MAQHWRPVRWFGYLSHTLTHHVLVATADRHDSRQPKVWDRSCMAAAQALGSAPWSTASSAMTLPRACTSPGHSADRPMRQDPHPSRHSHLTAYPPCSRQECQSSKVSKVGTHARYVQSCHASYLALRPGQVVYRIRVNYFT